MGGKNPAQTQDTTLSSWDPQKHGCGDKSTQRFRLRGDRGSRLGPATQGPCAAGESDLLPASSQVKAKGSQTQAPPLLTYDPGRSSVTRFPLLSKGQSAT